MKAIDQPFTKLINGTMQFVTPVLEREYRWTKTDCEQFFTYLPTIDKDPSYR